MFPTTLSAQAEEGSTLVIPCRPTSPMSYLVKLTCHSHREVNNTLNKFLIVIIEESINTIY